MTSSHPTFAEWLTERRIAARYSIRELAKEAQVSHAAISGYESRSLPAKIPKPTTIRKIVNALGATSEERMRLYREALALVEGFVPKEKVQYIPNPDTARIAERYNNAPIRVQRAVEAMLDVVSDDEESGPSAARIAFELDRQGANGRRAE